MTTGVVAATVLQGKRLDIVRSEVVLSDLVSDVHCIIEAMIGKGVAVNLRLPQLLGVPEVGGGIVWWAAAAAAVFLSSCL